MNCLFSITANQFEIGMTTEVGGSSTHPSHGDIFSAASPSSYRSVNLTMFTGQTDYHAHYCASTIEFEQVVVCNTTANNFFVTGASCSNELMFKEIVVAYACNNAFSISGSQGSISIEDSFFIFQRSPSSLPSIVRVVWSISNKQLGDFEVVSNPKTPDFHFKHANSLSEQIVNCLEL